MILITQNNYVEGIEIAMSNGLHQLIIGNPCHIFPYRLMEIADEIGRTAIFENPLIR
jgi:hypothetical protein